RARTPGRGLRVPDHHGAPRRLDRAGAHGARRAGRVRALGACPHPAVPRRRPEGVDAPSHHPGAVHAVAAVHSRSAALGRRARLWSNKGVSEPTPLLIAVLAVAYLPPALVLSWTDGREHRLPNRWVAALTLAVAAALALVAIA